MKEIPNSLEELMMLDDIEILDAFFAMREFGVLNNFSKDELLAVEMFLEVKNCFSKFFEREKEILDGMLIGTFKYNLISKHSFQPKLVYKIFMKDVTYILKIFCEKHTFENEVRILNIIKDMNIKHSNIIYSGVYKEYFYVLKRYLDGRTYSNNYMNDIYKLEIAKELAIELAKINNINVVSTLSSSEKQMIKNDMPNKKDLIQSLEFLNAEGVIDNNQKQEILNTYVNVNELNYNSINLCYNYTDLGSGNIIVDESGLKGLIDFEHTRIGLVGKDIVNTKWMFSESYLDILEAYMNSYLEIKKLSETDIYQIICQYLKSSTGYKPYNLEQIKKEIAIFLKYV